MTRLIRCGVVWGLCTLNVSAQVPRPYTGAPVDVDFYGADLRMVLRSFAELGGLNLVIDPAVTGTIDITLIRVPWDQALDVILTTHKLGYLIEGPVVRVVPLSVLAAEEDARQKARDLRAPLDVAVRTFALNYARAADIEPVLKAAILTKHGDTRFDVRTNTLIVRDLPGALEAAAGLIATLDRAEPQVEIEARVVQTNRDSARALGVQWGGAGRVSPDLGNTTALTFPNTGAVAGRAVDDATTAVNLPVSGATSGAGLALGSITGALTLDVALTALERSGNGRILSTPRVTTQNNKQAEMTQGIQIPIQTVANNTTTVTFKDAALKLLVTPRITAAHTVIMDVELENATPDFSRQVNNIPPIDTQRARTTVQVGDGATTVIGGIFVSREQSTQDRTPGLHRVPLLGWLFKRDTGQDETRELLIFITPRILRSRS
ncbi:MAG: type IV pilus secretin PilQ [Acidobacteria bacterium]|nr:type IV pilus secretin PilQ [Acidobacteriota bacterium]